MEQQAITFRIPKDLYERLRREAFEERRTMNEIVSETLGARYALLDRGGAIDHADGDPKNNDPNNLTVWTEGR